MWLIFVPAMAVGLLRKTIDSAGFGLPDLSPSDYARTELGVIPHYLRLVLWPNPILIDYYDWPVAHSLTDLPAAAAVTLFCLVATAIFLRTRPAVGFVALALWVILLPTSSFVPLLHEAVAERRMYLPLIPIIALLTVGVDQLNTGLIQQLGLTPRSAGATIQRIGLVAGIAICLGVVTSARNADYADPVALYRYQVSHRPGNARTLTNFAIACDRAGLHEQALAECFEAIKLEPWSGFPDAIIGDFYLRQGDMNAAESHLTAAEQNGAATADVHRDLGIVYARKGDLARALPQFQSAAEQDPGAGGNHYYLATTLSGLGQDERAALEYAAACDRLPAEPTCWIERGRFLLKTHHPDRAAEVFRHVLQFDPGNPDAQEGLVRSTAPHEVAVPPKK